MPMPMAKSAQLLSRLEEIQRSASPGTFSDAFERAVADFGGIAFAIGVIPRVDIPFVSQERGLETWIEFYHDSGLYRDCPFTRRTTESLAPFTWDEEIEVAPDETYEVASAARGYGLSQGFHVPVVTRDGSHGGVFIQTEAGTLSSEQRQALNLLALAAHARLEEFEVNIGPTGESLSGREREVLLWFAEGKSAEDVGRIIGIAPATVMYHYRSVADRYGTLNRTHTVVEAMRRGALRL